METDLSFQNIIYIYLIIIIYKIPKPSSAPKQKGVKQFIIDKQLKLNSWTGTLGSYGG